MDCICNCFCISEDGLTNITYLLLSFVAGVLIWFYVTPTAAAWYLCGSAVGRLLVIVYEICDGYE